MNAFVSLQVILYEWMNKWNNRSINMTIVTRGQGVGLETTDETNDVPVAIWVLRVLCAELRRFVIYVMIYCRTCTKRLRLLLPSEPTLAVLTPMLSYMVLICRISHPLVIQEPNRKTIIWIHLLASVEHQRFLSIVPVTNQIQIFLTVSWPLWKIK